MTFASTFSSSFQPIIISLELGSSRTTVSAFDSTGTLVPGTESQRNYALESTGDAPLNTIMTCVEMCVDECLTSLRPSLRKTKIVGIGITTFAMSWLGIDSQGRPATPVRTYASPDPGVIRDLRNDPLTDQQKQQFHENTGVPLHSSFAAPHLRYLRQNQPDILNNVHLWQTLGSHLIAQWTEQLSIPINKSEASWTGLINRSSNVWDIDLIKLLEINPAQFPDLANFSEAARGLRGDLARRWPELAEVPLFTSVPLSIAANEGMNFTQSGRLAVTIGENAETWVIVRQDTKDLDDNPLIIDGLCTLYLDQNRFLVGGAITDGGSLFEWLVNNGSVANMATALANAGDLVPDSHELTIQPFLNGERCPGWSPKARLIIEGVHPGTTPAMLTQAMMEAVALRIRAIITRIPLSVLSIDTPVIAGGSALMRNSSWRQILADVLNRSVHLSPQAQGASRGVALMVLQALNIAAISPTIEADQISTPRPGIHEIMQRAATRQNSRYDFYFSEPSPTLPS